MVAASLARCLGRVVDDDFLDFADAVWWAELILAETAPSRLRHASDGEVAGRRHSPTVEMRSSSSCHQLGVNVTVWFGVCSG